MTSDCILVHFDPAKPLIVACDASPYGVGVVLSHRMESGKDQPIGFSSHTLAPAEKKYSQLEKEGLAVIFGVKRFRQYLLGKECEDCQCFRNQLPVAPLQPWEWPEKPWARVHADYAGPFLGYQFLILIDAHSKWMEVKAVTSASCTVTIDQMHSILPPMLASFLTR